MFATSNKFISRIVAFAVTFLLTTIAAAQTGFLTGPEIFNGTATNGSTAPPIGNDISVSDTEFPLVTIRLRTLSGSRLDSDQTARVSIAPNSPTTISAINSTGHVGGWWLGRNTFGGPTAAEPAAPSFGTENFENYALSSSVPLEQFSMLFGAVNNNEDGYEEIDDFRFYSDEACTNEITNAAAFEFIPTTEGSQAQTNPGGTAASFLPGSFPGADCGSGLVGPSAAFGTSPPLLPQAEWVSLNASDPPGGFNQFTPSRFEADGFVGRWSGRSNGTHGTGNPNTIFGVHVGNAGSLRNGTPALSNDSGYGAGCDAGGRLIITSLVVPLQCVTFTRTDVVNANTRVTGAFASADDQASNGVTMTNIGTVQFADHGDLPDTYSTTTAAGGPLHRIVPGLNIGVGTPDGNLDGIPTTGANGDDGVGDDPVDDDNGVTFPGSSTAGGLQTVTVVVTNNTGGPANLCGWFDSGQDGGFELDEAVCVVVPSTPTGTQTINVPFTIPGEDRGNAGNVYSRFRLTTDPITTASFGGTAADGEVEDYVVSIDSLPVTLDSLATKQQGSRIRFNWSTSSETFNFGFNLWGEVEGEWHRLNKAVVPSRGSDSLVARKYRKRVSVSDLPGEVTAVGVSSVELNGHEEFYGPFAVGEKVGDELTIEPIDWNAIAAEASAQLKAQGYVQRGRNFVRERKASRLAASMDLSTNQSLSGNTVLAEFRSETIGMHRVSHAELVSAGINLSGLNTNDLALMNNGSAQVRFISGGVWNADSIIDFYNAGVSDEVLLNTSENVFRLEHDAGRTSVLAAGVIDRSASRPDASHTARVVRNEQRTYDFVMPKPDPWYERYLFLSRASGESAHTFTLDVNNVTGDTATVTARVITLSDFGEGMDHRLELVHVNGGVENVIGTQDTDGYATVELSGSISGAELAASNVFKIKQKPVSNDPLTGQPPAHWLGSAAAFDRASVTFDSSNIAADNVMHWQNASASGDGYVMSGFNSANIAAYAHANGSLMRLNVATMQLSGANLPGAHSGWVVSIPAIATGDADYWVSTENALLKPAIASPEIDAAALQTGSADYVIIAYPNFTNRLLNPGDRQDFVANKERHGHSVQVVDYEQVAQVYGYGLRTPDAIAAYLKAETQSNANLKYVLLVGNASRDANDYTGNADPDGGSMNFIPTYYDRTHDFLNYAPNDGRLADTNGDGYQDLAIGRWPARTAADLNNMIAKTIAYTDGTGTTQATQTLGTAVLAADVNDGSDFSAQMDDVGVLLSNAGFTNTKVYKDHGDSSQDLINAINQGQSITSYSGHAGPSQWSYNGVLRYNQVDQLTNTEHPTLMLPLSCYTTYTVSEHTDTLGQKLIASDAGAVAMMGASSLSDYGSNQAMITHIVQSMMQGVDTNDDGNPDVTLSLGEAVAKAKKDTASADSPINISGNLIGDPSIRISAGGNMSLQALRSY